MKNPRMAVKRQAESMENPPHYGKLLGPLPVVLRFLRCERNLAAEEIDRELDLPQGSYEAYELGQAAPRLGTLERILLRFELDFRDFDSKLEAMAEVSWPLRTPLPKDAKRPKAEDFMRAFEVIRDFEYSHMIHPDRWRPPQHGFDTFAAALGWLRRFLGLTQVELANLAGLSAGTISVLEAGRRKPSNDTRFVIGRFVQPIYNDLLAVAGARGAPPCWQPPRTRVRWEDDTNVPQ